MMGPTHDMLAVVQYLLCFAALSPRQRTRLERLETYLCHRYLREE